MLYSWLNCHRILWIFVLVQCVSRISGKNFGKCELAEELAFRHDVPLEEVPHWVCIAKHESTFDTSAINRNYWDGSKDYGLFQINDRYWCSPPDDQNSCRVNCVDLLDDDIRNDVKCARKIFKIHRRNEGNGFLAWTAWKQWCRYLDMSNYVSDCFNDTLREFFKMSTFSGGFNDIVDVGMRAGFQPAESGIIRRGSETWEENPDDQDNALRAISAPTCPACLHPVFSTTSSQQQPEESSTKSSSKPVIFVPMPGYNAIVRDFYYHTNPYPQVGILAPGMQTAATQPPVFFKARPLSWYSFIFGKPAEVNNRKK